MARKLQMYSINFLNLVTLLLSTVVVCVYNIPWDGQRNENTEQMTYILKPANFSYYVEEITHKPDHILALLKSRDDDNLVDNVSVSFLLFDHFLINSNIFPPIISLFEVSKIRVKIPLALQRQNITIQLCLKTDKWKQDERDSPDWVLEKAW